MLSGVITPDAGTLVLHGQEVRFGSPTQARKAGIEMLHQSLALVDVFNVPENIFLGRELSTRRFGIVPVLDKAAMRERTMHLLQRIGANLPSIDRPVRAMSGGQRQAVAIARAVHFNARILIMDEPTAALGPAETAQVRNLVRQLKDEGIGIFLISHDIHDVFDLADRISVMYHGRVVGTVNKTEVTTDEVLGMIILGKPLEKISAEEVQALH
jgi:D-xylose transport system ATP-binding protein